MTSQLDWDAVLSDVKDALISGCEPSYRAISRYLDIPYTTLHNGLLREFNINTEDLENLIGENYKKTEDSTSLIVDIKTRDIRSLDDMLVECKVDLDIWEVERYLINKYPGYRRDEKADMHWKDGKIVDGWKLDHGQLTISQLFQIKVWLRRKTPLRPEIVIQPVEITIKILFH